MRRKAALLRPSLIRKHHRGSRIVQSRRIAGGDRAVRAESRLQLGERLERRVGPIGSSLSNGVGPFLPGTSTGTICDLKCRRPARRRSAVASAAPSGPAPRA